MFLGGYRRWAICLVAIALLLTSCTNANPSANRASDPAAPAVATPPPASAEPFGADVATDIPRLAGKAKVELVVNGKKIVIEVDGDKAPVTAGNFIDLVQKEVYNNTVFHRVVKEPQPFVAQGGDPQSKDPNFPANRLGTGGYIDPSTQQERSIPLEILPADAPNPLYSQTLEMAGISEKPALSHVRGAVAMARSQFPDSASSQFYITLSDLPFLDGNYAVFGTVLEGMDVVDSIQQGDRIESAKVIEGADGLQAPRATEAPTTEAQSTPGN
jgi:peptidyl-prolyl cis-trans isomerase B (cyclophilin B)